MKINKELIIFILTILISLSSFYISSFLNIPQLGIFSLIVLGFLSTATIFLPSISWIAIYYVGISYNIVLASLFAGFGASIGELTAYYLGKEGKALLNKNDLQVSYVKKFGPLAVFIFSIIPNPFFDVVGIAAGALNIPLYQYLLSCFLGKSIKFFLLFYFGASFINFFQHFIL